VLHVAVSGHTRVYRKPYAGPRVLFEPRLVTSTSSHEQSQEVKDTGNDADDELVTGTLQIFRGDKNS